MLTPTIATHSTPTRCDGICFILIGYRSSQRIASHRTIERGGGGAFTAASDATRKLFTVCSKNILTAIRKRSSGYIKASETYIRPEAKLVEQLLETASLTNKPIYCLWGSRYGHLFFSKKRFMRRLDVNFLRTGAAMVERLARSPPTKAIRGQSPAGSLRIFACGNRAGRWRWSAGFPGDLPFPPPFHSGAAPYSSESPSSALKTSMLRAVQITLLLLLMLPCGHVSVRVIWTGVHELTQTANGIEFPKNEFASDSCQEPTPKDISEIGPNRIICWKAFPVHEAKADNTAVISVFGNASMYSRKKMKMELGDQIWLYRKLVGTTGDMHIRGHWGGGGGAVTPDRSRVARQLDRPCQSSRGFPAEGKQQGSERVGAREGRVEEDRASSTGKRRRCLISADILMSTGGFPSRSAMVVSNIKDAVEGIEVLQDSSEVTDKAVLRYILKLIQGMPMGIEYRGKAATCIADSNRTGAAVVERVACSRHTKANRVQSPAGVTSRFSYVEIVPDDAVGRWFFSGISRYPPALVFRRCTLVTSSLTPAAHAGEQHVGLPFVSQRPVTDLPASSVTRQTQDPFPEPRAANQRAYTRGVQSAGRFRLWGDVAGIGEPHPSRSQLTAKVPGSKWVSGGQGGLVAYGQARSSGTSSPLELWHSDEVRRVGDVVYMCSSIIDVHLWRSGIVLRRDVLGKGERGTHPSTWEDSTQVRSLTTNTRLGDASSTTRPFECLCRTEVLEH
ncbi:hypothetical protein PR048_007089 [Dryococelus australis]|uniref:Uncharacterized protein n=1 Tax=Dryococelus australis TaxID=614101 RepID=A0ABQ9ICN3_9NEOP|nr:hypothetical protein PR048_007089 [Dryococelus australis]